MELENGTWRTARATNVVEKRSHPSLPRSRSPYRSTGPTLEAIAGEKTGISETRRAAIVARQQPGPVKVREREARRLRHQNIHLGSSGSRMKSAADGLCPTTTAHRFARPRLIGRESAKMPARRVARFARGQQKITAEASSRNRASRLARAFSGPLLYRQLIAFCRRAPSLVEGA